MNFRFCERKMWNTKVEDGSQKNWQVKENALQDKKTNNNN